MTKVVLLTIDAFRVDYLSPKTTPFISELSKKGRFYTSAIATGSGTSSSFPGIFASALPMDHGYASIRTEHRTIAEQLSPSVCTIGISSSTPTSRIYNFDRGFDIWVDNTSTLRNGKALQYIRDNPSLYRFGKKALGIKRRLFDNHHKTPPYMSASEVTDTIIDSIDGVDDGSMFLWAHYMDVHTPYYPPNELVGDVKCSAGEINAIIERYNELKPPVNGEEKTSPIYELSDKELEAIKSYYEAEATYIDRELERLVTTLDNQWDDYCLIITADHGEEFLEHGHFGHQPKLYDELINVPLIVYQNGDSNNGMIDRIVSLLDIPPTVTDLYDVPPHDSWRGCSLLQNTSENESNNAYAISELCHTSTEGLGGTVNLENAIVSVRTESWKFILNRQSGSTELYDLSNDPSERNNIYGEEIDIVDELRSICEERLKNVSDESSSVSVSDDVQSRLEELGYLER